jgi:pyruvate dehydrogenase E2 component (dihydrolipoamide acetyltransferase)
VSPLARKIADEAGVDLSGVQGSGPSGRIVRKDVEEVLSRGGSAVPAMASTAQLAPTQNKGAGKANGQPLVQPASQPVGKPAFAAVPAAAALASRLIPVSNMRRVIAQRLAESKSTIPHYQVSFDIEMTALMALRAQLNEQLANQGVKLSVNDFLVKACGLAMHQPPTGAAEGRARSAAGARTKFWAGA